MNEENPYKEIDWHRLSRQEFITLNDLIVVLLGHNIAYLKNLPPDSSPSLATIPKVVPDLFDWIKNDCADGKIKCTDIEQDNPSFQLNEICRWLGKNNIPWWLLTEKNVLVSIEGCKFIEEIAYGHTTKPLKTDRNGFIDWGYYGALSSWPVRMAIQLLNEANHLQDERIEEALRLSVLGKDEWLIISLFPPNEKAAGLFFNPTLFCNWADTKGFSIPRGIREVQLGGNKNKLKEEMAKMGSLLKSYDKQIKKEPEKKISVSNQASLEDIEKFIQGITLYFSDPYIFVRAAGGKPTPYTLPSLGFKKPEGVTAQDFISILTNPAGPCYSLGPSHSCVDSGEKPVLGVGGSGENDEDEYTSQGMGYSESMDDSKDKNSGFHMVENRTELPDYRVRMARLKDINKKLCKFIEKAFPLCTNNSFKLYNNDPARGNGEYRFKFQTKLFKKIKTEKFPKDKRKILEKLKILNDIGDDESLNEYTSLWAHAIDQGITELQVEKHLNPQKNL